MAGPWDSVMKRMIGANPEDFVRWLASEATFVAALDIELKSQHIYADALLQVNKRKKPGILHLEVQTEKDPDMGVRLLEYCKIRVGNKQGYGLKSGSNDVSSTVRK